MRAWRCSSWIVLAGVFAEDPEDEAEQPAPAITEPVRSDTVPAEVVEPDGPDVFSGTVLSVVDGDTVRVQLDDGLTETVRLIGIDTPETRDPGEPVQCFGPQATATARKLLPSGQEVRLVTDLSQDERDRFDRLLAYVYKPGKSGVASVNRALVASGRAKVYVFEEPFRYLRAFEQAELAARRQNLGLWGPPCNGDTTQPQPRPAAPPPPPEPEPVPVEPEPAPAPPPAPAPESDYSPPLPPYPPDGLRGRRRADQRCRERPAWSGSRRRRSRLRVTIGRAT